MTDNGQRTTENRQSIALPGTRLSGERLVLLDRVTTSYNSINRGMHEDSGGQDHRNAQ